MPHRTVQRDAISRVLKESEQPLNAKEILEAAKQFSRHISIATIYRELKRLTADKVIRPVELPGEAPRYEISKTPHYCHIKDLDTGEVHNLEWDINNLEAILPAGYTHVSHEIVIYCKRTDGESEE
jgi:Fur family ferric uptake transcriptional regulator